MPSPQPRSAVKLLRFLAGLAVGVLFVCLFYPAAYLLACLLARAGLAGRWPQIILCALCVLVLPLFFWLRRRADRLLSCGQIAFPAGAFLAADLMMLAIPAFDLLNAARLLEYADNSQPLARQFAYNSVVLIFGLVLLVLCWLISVLWKLLLRFRAMTEALEREEAREKAAAAAPRQSPAAPDKPSANAEPSSIATPPNAPEQTPAATHLSDAPSVTAAPSSIVTAPHAPDPANAETETPHIPDQANADQETPRTPDQTDTNTDASAQ